MSLDAVIISDSGIDSLSGTNPLKLNIDNSVGNIQVIANFLRHNGQILSPIKGDGVMNWASAPKLNGIYLLNFLLRNKFNVELVDRYHEQKTHFRYLLKRSPKAIIISTSFIHNKKALYDLVKDIRELANDVFIIAGGPFIYLSYLLTQRIHQHDYDTDSAKNDYLFLDFNQEPSIDLYIASPRGEKILCQALTNLKNGRSSTNLPNTAYLSQQRYNFNNRIDDESNAVLEKIDWASLPDYLFKSKVIPMQASAGCPYNCNFCNFTKDVGSMIIKPIDDLIEELKAVSKKGIKYVWFVDDNFRLGKDDLNAVCKRFLDENIQLKWMTFIRASTLENVDVELMRKSGCIEVQLGLESADIQILDNMNKKSDPTLYLDVVGRMLSAGINCSCYFIFGFPGETEATAQRTRDFIKSIEFPDFEGSLSWSLFPFILSPLSPIYELKMRDAFNLSGYLFNWKHATMNSVQAQEQVKKTFFELENSGPIYRGDNLKLLEKLTSKKRKQFFKSRHALSKLAAVRKLNKHDIISRFSSLL